MWPSKKQGRRYDRLPTCVGPSIQNVKEEADFLWVVKEGKTKVTRQKVQEGSILLKKERNHLNV